MLAGARAQILAEGRAQTHRHTGGIIKDARGSTCADDCGILCTDDSTDSMGVHGSTCPYFSSKCMGMCGVTSTEGFTVKTVVCSKTNAYDKYRRYKSIWDMGTDVVGKLRKGTSYADALKQVS